jgi:hypothetical protein
VWTGDHCGHVDHSGGVSRLHRNDSRV